MLGRIEVLNPRSQWQHEERDFTPWLAENIEYLSEVIGIDIEIEETEKRVGNYELDIFGRIEGTDEVVIIENQLEQSDHKHLGQLLTYGAGLDASVCIWVTPYINDEHKQAVEWLNSISEDKRSFFLVRPELIKIDDSKPAVRFYLEAGPSQFSRTIRVLKDKNSPRHAFRRMFWQGLIDHLNDHNRPWAKNRRTTSDSWMTFSVGVRQIYISVSMARGERLRAEITFNGGTQEENKANFYRYANEETYILNKFSDEVIFEELPSRKMSRIGVYRDYNKRMAEENLAYAQELYIWYEGVVERLYEVINKIQ